ncbi:hypothetical protein [Acinetobacter sp. P1(2025)]
MVRYSHAPSPFAFAQYDLAPAWSSTAISKHGSRLWLLRRVVEHRLSI